MRKSKIKDQSLKLRKAEIEFYIRSNEERRRSYENYLKDLEKSPLLKDMAELVEKCFLHPAVIGAKSLMGNADISFSDLAEDPSVIFRDENFPLVSALDCMGYDPKKTLYFAVDLSRSKEVIMMEFEEILDRHRRKADSRLKWIGIIDMIIEVWDLYDQSGQQPWRKTFRQISRKVGRPLSTVKDQWYLAYEKIYGKPYDPDSRYSTEEKKGSADELCARCPNGATCYKKSGEWIPCPESRLSGLSNRIVI